MMSADAREPDHRPSPQTASDLFGPDAEPSRMDCESGSPTYSRLKDYEGDAASPGVVGGAGLGSSTAAAG